MTDYGIDISHWNIVRDWRAVRGHNITYASIKLTESTAWVDDAAPGHAAGAHGAGIAAGGYHFARPGNPAAQAEHFAAHLRARGLLGRGALAPMLDMEATELRDTANPFATAFIAHLRALTGIRRVLVYANLDWFTRVLRPGEWADDDVLLWIARYNGDPGHPGWSHPKLALHQHSNTGRVRGIPGHVDRNATLGGFTREHLLLDGAPTPAPTPAPGPSAGGGTYTIRAGDTLSEIAARHDTTTAALAALNNITNPDRIYAGHTLRLPANSGSGGNRYRIQSGDTLSGLAQRFDTTVATLARVNGISDPDRIYAGQWLTLP